MLTVRKSESASREGLFSACDLPISRLSRLRVQSGCDSRHRRKRRYEVSENARAWRFLSVSMRCATATSPRVSRAKAPHGALTRPLPSFRPMASNPALAPTALPAQAEGMGALRAAVEDRRSIRTRNVEGMRALREGPDAKSVFSLDQFGVLHDGKVAYPCAIEATRRLRESGARLFIISNSSRRASGTLAKLEKLGFDPEWFEGVVTSGEITHTKLGSRNERHSTFRELGDRCLHFTWSARGAVALDGVEGLFTVDAETFSRRGAEAVDFLLAHGTECVNGAGASDRERVSGSKDMPIEAMKPLLRLAAKASLPLVVANPDLVTVGGEDGLLPMPGTLASWYAEMPGAGPIYLMGKPGSAPYETLAQMTRASKEETVAVGDSLEHDVNGAAAFGIDSAFVCGGIHAEALGYEPERLLARNVGDGSNVPAVDASSIETLADESRCARPTVAMPVFRW